VVQKILIISCISLVDAFVSEINEFNFSFSNSILLVLPIYIVVTYKAFNIQKKAIIIMQR
jgi:hypothetical protein